MLRWHRALVACTIRVFNVDFFCKNEACVKCGTLNATTLIWLLSHTEKPIVVHSFVSVASLFSLSIYVSFFSPLFLVPPKSVTLGKPEPVRAGESLQVFFYKKTCLETNV